QFKEKLGMSWLFDSSGSHCDLRCQNDTLQKGFATVSEQNAFVFCQVGLQLDPPRRIEDLGIIA
ncbi:Hypothetical predicted protein, partial [Pelobates cultripes]